MRDRRDDHDRVARRATGDHSDLPIGPVVIGLVLVALVGMVFAAQRHSNVPPGTNPWGPQATPIGRQPPPENTAESFGGGPGVPPPTVNSDAPPAPEAPAPPQNVEAGLLQEGTQVEIVGSPLALSGSIDRVDEGCPAQPRVTLQELLMIAQLQTEITITVGTYADRFMVSAGESITRDYRTVRGCGIRIEVRPGPPENPGNPEVTTTWLRLPE